MTITAFPARNEYTATSGQTLFTYTFKIYASTDLNVYVTPSGQDANDVTDIVTGYSVTGLGDEDGGTITLVAAVSVGDLVTIVSDIPENRTTDYQDNGDFLPDTVNADFDRVVSLTKREADRSGRTLSFQESLQGMSGITLPAPEALKYVRWKADESGQENVDPVDADTIVQADFVERVENISELANLTIPSANKTYEVLGRTAAGDGGGGTFYWDSSDLATEVTADTQSGIYVAPNSDSTGASGAWIRQFSGRLDVRWFGAVEGGSVDCFPAIIAVYDFADVCELDDGTWLISDTITLIQGKSLIGKGAKATSITASFTGAPMVHLFGGYSVCEDVTLVATGIRLTSVFDNLSHGVQIAGLGGTQIPVGCIVDRCFVDSQPSHGIYSASQQVGGSISHNLVTECRGHAYAVDSGGLIGETNTRNGLFNMVSNVAQNCGGYGLYTAEVPLRMRIDNHEVTDCAWNNTEISVLLPALKLALVYLNGQNMMWEIGACNDSRFAETTLNNGQTRYAKGVIGSGIIISEQTKGVTFTNPRWLNLLNGLLIDGAVDGIFVNQPYFGGTSLTTNVRVNVGALATGGRFDLSSDTGVETFSNSSVEVLKATIDGEEFVSVGSATSGYFRNVVVDETISLNALNISGTVINLTGEGDVADNLASIKVAGSAYPVPDGESVTVLNNNAYDITIKHSTGNLFTLTGADVILTQGQTMAFRVYAGGNLYQI